VKKLSELVTCDPPPVVTSVTVDDYDSGDKRSYGHLSVSFDTCFGRVELKDLAVGSASSVEFGWGEKYLVDGEEVEVNHAPDLFVPHYYAGGNAEYNWKPEETLPGELQTWLDDHRQD
jgi:hypothetical protein